MKENEKGLRFEQLFGAVTSAPALPPLQTFHARDGVALPYRHYPCNSPVTLVLIHGSSSHSEYLCRFAASLAKDNMANVYTPDVRGHGLTPQRRGDIDYIEQLEDDLADFISHLKTKTPQPQRIIVGGHSSGGGLAIRFGGGRHGYLASAYLLLAPYLGYNAPTVRPDSGGWVKPSTAKIIAISILNGFGVTRFNAAPVIRFNVPIKYQTGTETLSYSFRLMTGFNPINYKKEIAAIKAPLCVLVGSEDEAFRASEFEPAIKPLAPHAIVKIIKGATHLGLVADGKAATETAAWLRTLTS